MTPERDRAMTRAIVDLTEALMESLTEVQEWAAAVDNGGTVRGSALELVAGLLSSGLADVDAVASLCGEASTEIAQLQAALDRRVLIEQAKGALSARAGITAEMAWLRIRHYARTHSQRAVDVARAMMDGSMSAEDAAELMEPLP